MTEKKHVYQAEVIALPPLKMVLGEIPSPDPEWRRKRQPQKPSREMETTVKRLIAHLKEDEK
jgi:hypothetical protein